MKITLAFLLLFNTQIYQQENIQDIIQDLIRKGEMQAGANNFDSASKLYLEASKLSESHELWDYYYRAELKRSLVTFVSGKTERSDSIIQALEEKRSFLVNLQDSTVAKLFYVKANIQWRKGLYLLSEKSISEASKIAHETGVPAELLANIALIQGNVQLGLFNYPMATRAYLKCVELIGEEQNSLKLLVFNNLGVTYLENANYSKALEYFKNSETLSRLLLSPNHSYNLLIYENIANLYFELEKYEYSNVYYKKLLNLSESIMPRGDKKLARNYTNYAALLVERHDYDSAEHYLNKSLNILKAKQAGRFKSSVYAKFSRIFELQGDYQKAVSSLNTALHYENLHSSEINNPGTLQYLIKKGDLYEKMLEFDSAVNMYNQGLSRVLKDFDDTKSITATTPDLLVDGNYDELIRLFLYRVRVFNETDPHSEEIDHTYAYVETIFDKIEEGYITPEELDNFGGLENFLTDLKIRTLYQRNPSKLNNTAFLGSVFKVLGERKSKVLKWKTQSDLVASKLGVEEHSSINQKNSAEIRIAYLKTQISNSVDSIEKYKLRLDLFELESVRDSLVNSINDTFPGVFGLNNRYSLIEYQDFKKAISADEIYIEYFIADTSIYVLATFDSGGTFFFLPYQAKQDDTYKNNLKRTINDNLKELLKVLESEGKKISKITIVPDDVLWNVDFGLLLTGEAETDNPIQMPYLFKEYAISYTYSTSLLFDNDSDHRANLESLLAFSYGKSDDEYGNQLSFEVLRSSNEELPGSRAEIKEIANHLEGAYFYGNFASEKKFKELASRYQILHLALHGEVDDNESEYSKLYFYSKGDTIEDGKLHAFELYNMDLNADLAVLSACNTGSGEIVKGEGVISLGRAFAYAGVNSLLLTRNEVSDAVAPEIMRVFYRELKNGRRKSEALRQAKLEFLENANNINSDPFYWSSFYILGDDSPIEFEDKISYWQYISILIVSGALAFTWFRKRKFSK